MYDESDLFINDVGPYFELRNFEEISDIKALLSLNTKDDYGKPGIEYEPAPFTQDRHTSSDLGSINSPSSPISLKRVNFTSKYKTSGIFRGQLQDWPLKPKGFRNTDIKKDPDEVSDTIKHYRYRERMREFYEFCEKAELHNPDFPESISDRMSIAQHFGVDTPLLDWSKNIFTALFFPINEMWSSDPDEVGFYVYIYHVIDERVFSRGIPPEEDLSSYNKSSFIDPPYIDRRIERQQGVFTFHPHPIVGPDTVPVDVYVLQFDIMQDIADLMEGMGFTHDYFFPDYAGIAEAVSSSSPRF